MTQELVIGLAERMRKRPLVRAPVAKRARRGNGRFRRGRRANGVTSELKFHDLDIDDASIAANGTIAQVSCLTIAQGTTESERIGRKVVVKSINWRYSISTIVASTSTATEPLTVRVVLYLDKQTNGATATVTGILESDDYQSFNQLANKSRFRTLMDRTHTLNPNGIAGDGSANDFNGFTENYTFFKKVSIGVEYDNTFTTGVIGTMRSNNIGVLLLGKNTGGVFDSKMRIRFSDG